MAAPLSKTIGDFNGKWVMNKSESTSVEPGLILQNIGWVTRKIVAASTITLSVNQYTGPPSPPAEPTEAAVTHIEIEQTGTAGLKGSTEKRCLDFTFREHTDWLFGTVRGQSKWIALPNIDDAFLAEGWLEGDEEKTGPGGESHVLSHVESVDNGWTATQIWGFKLVEGVRKYARNIVVAKGTERAELKLVYDYFE
ncbi:hypothetical protein B0T26DRAFT_632739 [Lasiosphaeria miniovina]|uniref:LCCL domain-containing protein n=1 Tax=Lasiosphaeria miniovina TaxID=1954250 RepID=A0AA40EG21_9PEZI|nr:uncharacterized protein B0T26DRAFT_632739 [Lasiosphaeria miniovina]KAK0733938.1 hypothetical protein B0T26DRAFT_632739 [Lasiosphaeria miniovina]